MKRRYNPNRNRRKGAAPKKSQQWLKKKVDCNYCGDEITELVQKKAKGPFYHNDLCKQAWEAEQSGGPILASSKNYHDIEENTLWRELQCTSIESAEDALNNLIFEKRSKRSGWEEPTDAAFSYNHLGEIIHSAVDKETLREQIKAQELSVLWLRNKLETFCATRCIMNTTLKKRDCKLPH